MPKKKELGQFMTTNYQYILSGMEIPAQKTYKKGKLPFLRFF